MLVSVERLLLRVRQVPSRGDELDVLYRRVRSEGTARAVDDERTLASELRALKVRIAATVGAVSACTRCAAGRPGTRGVFAGGDCCSGVTADLFSDDEVAALALAGTRPRHLRAPRGEHAGCAFRGATGCTLSPAHRPQRCIQYTCELLRRELRARGDLAGIDDLLDELRRLMLRFVEIRRTRLDVEVVTSVMDAVRLARASP